MSKDNAKKSLISRDENKSELEVLREKDQYLP